MMFLAGPAGRCRPGRALFTAGATLAVAATLLSAAPVGQRQRTVHVTVVGDKGRPIDGLSADDLIVKEDGKTCAVLDAGPATAPLSVAVLLDDRGSDINEIRAALAAFVTRVQGRAEVSLVSVVPSTTTVFDYTSDPTTMIAGLRRLVWRPGQAGGLVLGAIADAAEALRRREAPRGAIVVVTFEGDEFRSHRRAADVQAVLAQSRAALHVVAVGTPRLRRMNRARVESGDVQGDEWTVDESNRNAVLGEGPKLSGGRRHELTAATGLSRALEQVATDLLHQYTIVYASESAPGASPKLSVSVKRRGVTLHAPARMPG
jgi:VWFA-related protein